jgi:HEAT repeat protein
MAPFPRTLFAVGALTGALWAHGGQYRGPDTPMVPGPRAPGGPSTGGPANPGVGTPTTGSGPVITEEVSWQAWWEFNKDEFLQLGTLSQTAPTTGSDDFYLGQRRTEAQVDTMQPTLLDLREHIVPALVQLMGRERNRDIQSACAMALGKVGLDATGIDITHVLAGLIARDDQEVRETAVLAIGVAARPQGLPLLLSLLHDDAQGRKLAARAEVGDRTRAYAAYALGFLARRSEDGSVKQAVHDALLAILRDKAINHRDLRTAAVCGLGLLVASPERSAHKRLAWQTVEELAHWYQLDLGRGDETIQAQASIAIGRLLGRGTSPVHERMKELFVVEFTATHRRSNAILQSAALALGMLCQAGEVHAKDTAFSLGLRQQYDRGTDRLSRYFALMALGRIGGAANRQWLLQAYTRGHKATERPWIVLALGLIAQASARAGTVDEAFTRLVIDELPNAPKQEPQAAYAVALGLSGDGNAVGFLMKHLRDNETQENLAGYSCVGLALLGDPIAAPLLGEVLERSQRRPFLLLQAAVGLGRIGDKTATQRLLDMLGRSESVVVLAACATAIGQIGDKRAIEPLIAVTKNDQVTKLARAFAAAALGSVGDRSLLPWNMPLSRDSNYGAPVDSLMNGSTGVLDIL